MQSMMTARQVAELLGVHENWVYDQAVGGKLPSYKIGGTRRFDPDELRSWIAGHREAENDREPRKPRRSSRRMVAMATARLDTQHEDRQSALEQSVRTSRRQDEKTVRVDDEPQPRLFEL
jgi:excisionase family DNA binding protein